MSSDKVSVECLQPGVYVVLDLGWDEHPFFASAFRIHDASEIAALKELGIAEVRIDPARSTAEPLSAPAPVLEKAKAERELWQQKKQRKERLRKHRRELQDCERHYEQSMASVKDVMKHLGSRSAEAMAQAHDLVGGMAEAFSAEQDVLVHLMSTQAADDTSYYHAVNVTVLSMMLARELKLPSAIMKILGLGALFHDVGKTRLPWRITHPSGELSEQEQLYLEQHPTLGIDLLKKGPGLPEPALAIVGQHHEHLDGSGYPRRLRGEQIPLVTRIVTIVNEYDELSNASDDGSALTPHEALSYMFRQLKPRYDAKLLARFIRIMGVYPPGSLVELVDGRYGICISTDATDPLKPSILLHDSQVPREEALILSLMEFPEMKVARSLRPEQLPDEVFEYLSPRNRLSYYFDPKKNPPDFS